MMIRQPILAVMVMLSMCELLCGGSDGLVPESKVRVASKLPLHAQAFALPQVRLLDGPLKRAMELDRKYLLSFDVDRLLYDFRVNAGLPAPGKPLGGWEKPDCEVRGHFTGHYMTACALMYAATGDPQLKAKGNAVVAGLAACQDKMGTGYLSAYPVSFIDRVEKCERVWAPYYTLHKILAGLLDMYAYCDNAQALESCCKFADWVVARNGRLTDAQMQKMLDNEHGGMNEVLANLYGVTGEQKYLAMAMRFNHIAVIGPAAHRQDELTGLHANTQIPKFTGTARLYELTGEAWLGTASKFFWETVVHQRSYVIGGNSDGEHFSPKETLSQALGPNTTETCNTYNMLKLTRHLFCWEPKVEYADYYERALYNHILASQDPHSGMMCYYVPLRSGSHKTYNTPMDSFWCCTGTGVENHAKYGNSIYFHDGADRLYVNLFVASELNWADRSVTIRQETSYPKRGDTRLVFTCNKPTRLQVSLRRPGWATEQFTIRVNGQPVDAVATGGEYCDVERIWKTGDVIEVAMEFPLRVEAFHDNPRRFAVLHGPLVLCAPVNGERQRLPVVVGTPADALASLQPVVNAPSTFAATGNCFRSVADSNKSTIELLPFYKMHGDQTYVVYWDALTAEQWKKRQDKYQAEQQRLRELAERTIDVVLPRDAECERRHDLQGERTGAGPFGGRNWRHASNGGWFSWRLRVLPNETQQLYVMYWGSDSGNRIFDILVDDQKLATQRLQNDRPGDFFTQIYELPAATVGNKDHLTVRFQAHPRATAGGVFELRTVRASGNQQP